MQELERAFARRVKTPPAAGNGGLPGLYEDSSFCFEQNKVGRVSGAKTGWGVDHYSTFRVFLSSIC